MLDTRTPETSLSEALLMVDRAIAKIPDLTTFGVGVSRRFNRDGKAAVARQTTDQQAALYTQSSLRMVAVSIDWIKLRLLQKSFNPHIGSYALKALVQEYRDGKGDPDPFIHNGAFIAAAVGLGFPFVLAGPNAVFEFRSAGVSDVR